MSNFLLVIPEGWTQLDWQFITNNVPDMSKPNVENWINGGQITLIEELLKTAGIIAPDKTINGAKLIDDTYFLVELT